MFYSIYFKKVCLKILFKRVFVAICVSVHHDKEHKPRNYIPLTLSLLNTALRLNCGI